MEDCTPGLGWKNFRKGTKFSKTIKFEDKIRGEGGDIWKGFEIRISGKAGKENFELFRATENITGVSFYPLNLCELSSTL